MEGVCESVGRVHQSMMLPGALQSDISVSRADMFDSHVHYK